MLPFRLVILGVYHKLVWTGAHDSLRTSPFDMLNLMLPKVLAIFESQSPWLYLGLLYEPRVYQRLLFRLDSIFLRLILDLKLLLITLSRSQYLLVLLQLLLFYLLLLLQLKHVLHASTFMFNLFLCLDIFSLADLGDDVHRLADGKSVVADKPGYSFTHVVYLTHFNQDGDVVEEGSVTWIVVPRQYRQALLWLQHVGRRRVINYNCVSAVAT